ncbi:MAG: HEAT repeat domain-containing protein [Xenococcus sp. MO_188.B8]|nr:HEAT repeat domain-containing protein [Xenococcus sp. MO_188.B8]
MNVVALVTPIIGQIVLEIAKKINNKINPDELQQALIAGIKAAEAEDQELPFEQHLFFQAQKDGFKGVRDFLEYYFKLIGVQKELTKSFEDQGSPDVGFLVEAFKKTAEKYRKVNPIESRIKPWLTTFARIYFQETSTYLKFQVAKEDYFKQLNKRYDNIKFAGIAVSGQEEERKRLQQIFVMPDVAKIEQNLTPIPEEFIAEELTQQEQIFLEQKQLARLTKSSSTTFLAKRLLTETPAIKAVILGAPGSGKSTLVSYFAVMLAQGEAGDLGLDGNIDWLPIVIEIRDLERNLDLNILKYLHQFAEINLVINKLPEDFFEHWLKQGKALILLDGIDEVVETGKREKVVERINLFLNQYNQNIAIVTSRPSGYKRHFFSTAEFPHYQLQPFDDDKIKTFIDYWYKSRLVDPQEIDRGKDTLHKAFQDNNRLKLLAKNPLLITIIALIHRYQAYLPKESHKLYDKAVETLLTSWDANRAISGYKVLKFLDLDDLRRLLESLARWVHSQGSAGDKEGGTQINKDELLKWLSKYIKTNTQQPLTLDKARIEAKRFLNYIRERTGLLNEQGTNRYAFVHKTFQEYLCAQDINYEADDEDDFDIVLDCIKEHLHEGHWREVLLLLVSQQKPQKALKAIRTIYENDSEYEQWLHRDLLFAGNCLADSPKGMGVKDREGLVDEIIQKLVELEISGNKKIGSKVHQQVFPVITSLVETDWEAKALKLLKQQQNQIEQFRFIEYQAELGEKEQAISTLLSLVQDQEWVVRYGAAQALGEIGQEEPEVITALLSLVQDQNLLVRSSAAQALGEIGQGEPEVITALLSLVQDQNLLVRSRAAQALGKIGQGKPEVIIALLPLVQDQEASVRSSAAQALGEIGQGKPEVIIDLLSLVQDQEASVRSRAAQALGKIGQGKPEVIIDLLPLVQDQDYSVRSRAAQALGNIGQGKPEVIIALLPLVQDQDYSVRSRAAQALGKIGQGKPEVITALLSLVQDQDYSVRSRAAQALGKIGQGEPEVITALLSLVQDRDSSVRSRAAQALGNIGQGEPEAVSVIKNWLEQNQDAEYVANGIDVLWNLVADAD